MCFLVRNFFRPSLSKVDLKQVTEIEELKKQKLKELELLNGLEKELKKKTEFLEKQK